ncbi:MAG TPA: hypothetical protein VGT44_10440, partial [Ktedonobacteraceae bacterium]|nr:hypothetical protein [Ktedonobacteraceae bacterium]
MRKHFQRHIIVLLALVIALVGGIGANFVFAKGQGQSAASTVKPPLVSSGGLSAASVVDVHSVDMRNVSSMTVNSSGNHAQAMDGSTGVDPAVYLQRKAAAAHNARLPKLLHPYLNSTNTPFTPTPTTKFQGISDSPQTCSLGACQPSDMALATSSSWVVQGVNDAFAVYSTAGTLQAGWPILGRTFFNIPSPGSCDPTGPNLFDPRAFYDINDGRFWVMMIQAEGTWAGNSCPFASIYWIAVSQTKDPRGSWFVYGVNMTLGTQNNADYPGFGFDKKAVYFTANMFSNAHSFQYAEIVFGSKSLMEKGSTVSFRAFSDMMANGAAVDTVQPVETELTKSAQTEPELLINSFNINFGGGQCSSLCSGIVVWTLANPTGTKPTLTGVVISTMTYGLPPFADQPACTQCLETFDVRITGTPVYANGLISFALETGLNNGTQLVPGIFWGQVQPTFTSGKISGGSIAQSGYLGFAGDQAASFAAMMPRKSGNLLVVFDVMSHSLYPSIDYATRTTTDPAGTFESPLFLVTGQNSTPDTRWGDYSATSYDGFSTDNAWFAAQYTVANGDWSTY